MKKILALAIAALLMATGCSTTTGKDKPPLSSLSSSINVQLGGEPDTLDPAFAVTTAEESYIIHLFEGLTTLTDTLETAPGAAKSWSVSKSETEVTSYTFVLDPAAKWSDGQPVTAEDFIYSWTRTLSPVTKSPNAYKLFAIRGAQSFNSGSSKSEGESESAASDTGSSSTASSSSGSSDADKEKEPYVNPDGLGLSIGKDGELIVELEGGTGDFLTTIATPAWVPLRESAVKKNPESWYLSSKDYLSNGPYVLTKWERDERITMDRNKNYRNNSAVKAPKLNFVLSEDSELLLGALRDGSVQFATSVPQLELEQAGDALRQNVLLGGYNIVFNNNKSPTSDVKVRKALSLALDRTGLAAAMRDNSVAATGIIPPGSVVDGVDIRKKSGELVATTAKLDEAAKLLTEAGYEGGKGFPTINYLVSDLPAHQRMATEIAKTWGKLGITTELSIQKWDDYTVFREDGKFDVTHLSLFSGELFPSVFVSSWASSSLSNFAGYQNKEYDNRINLIHGIAAIPEEEPADEDKAAESKADEKTEDKKTEESKTEKTEEAKEEDKTEEGEEDDKAEVVSNVDMLVLAEKQLIEQDCAIAPISWYTGAYLTGTGEFGGFRFYPMGYVYFGGATYTPAKEDK